MNNTKQYMTADDVVDVLGVSKSIAYKIIRECNHELHEKGYLTVSGKVSSAYFGEKWYGMNSR